MSVDIAERIKCFRFIRDIPYRIALSTEEQDYCCATKAPMLQKLLAALNIQTRRISCEFAWADFGLPKDIVAKTPSPHSGHQYLEVFVPEKKEWVAVDPTWDSKLAAAGLPIAEWDGLNATMLAVKPVKTITPQQSDEKYKQIDALPPEAWQQFYQENRDFLGSINHWLDGHRRQLEKHAA